MFKLIDISWWVTFLIPNWWLQECDFLMKLLDLFPCLKFFRSGEWDSWRLIDFSFELWDFIEKLLMLLFEVSIIESECL